MTYSKYDKTALPVHSEYISMQSEQKGVPDEKQFKNNKNQSERFSLKLKYFEIHYKAIQVSPPSPLFLPF